ncbi:alpha/beta hydrolase [Flaviaesturariibacter aridisoli]|uniref:Alpha/beta hydrolase n=1 Tax=Flaviaesturariibacter aridisoli TaxID=2545761 RepID=A0A4R4E4M3_9BACT|nr:alpha/beta hydrolase [Flaviaesturariibacter aridisoli]TCZ72941.1 alpha/beta hydrolase [Flaviaesturariibacter aridisoli]
MKKTFISAALLLLLLGSAVTLHAQEDSAKTYKPVVLPAGFTSRLDVVYTKAGDWDGKMDLYLPAAGKPTPVIVNIHGGGWNHGVKESQTGFNTFFKAGFAVANIEYRLTGQATAPAAVEDSRCALVYLVQHAKELNIDPARIVVMGGSAGGHLALMAGLMGNDTRFDGACPHKEPIKVAAIIDKYGITDVWDWGYGSNVTSKSARNWLGARAQDKAFAASVSPMTYLAKTNPPVFIVHGDADPTVPYQHSVDLHKRLSELGVRTQFITVPGGQHGKFDKEKNSEINIAIMAFLREAGIY